MSFCKLQGEKEYDCVYPFRKGDCLIINGYRYLIKETKEEQGIKYAKVLHFQQFLSQKEEGKWIKQELLPDPIAHIDVDKNRN